MGVLTARAVIPPLERRIVRRWGRHDDAPPGPVAPVPPHPVAPPPEPHPPSARLALLVRFDERERMFRPSVQVRGPRWNSARIRLELVDRHGSVRLAFARPFRANAFNAEFLLPRFRCPDDASPDEVLGWHWDVVIDGEDAELRWREHPRPAEGLNAEAELGALTARPA